MIYAGAQKNIGPAGLNIVIIREDLLGDAAEFTPTMLNYTTHANAGSMYNTPPTYSWYLAGLVFKWIKKQNIDYIMDNNSDKQSQNSSENENIDKAVSEKLLDIRGVENGSVDYGVVPIENSTEGVVSHTLDVFMHSPLKISGEVSLRIHQNLMTLNDNWQDVKTVYSHQQSLAQCRQWLYANLPNAEQVPVSSNTEAARRAKDDPNSAAIAGALAAEIYGLERVKKNIEDNSDNTTRFLVIGKQDVSHESQMIRVLGSYPKAIL